jgi:surfeit locus 1 family protein
MLKKILAAFLCVISVCILLGLGTWQLHRLHWKEGLIAQQQVAQRATPISLEKLIALPEGAENFRAIRLEGQFIPEKRLLLGIRAFDGKAGYYSVVPFKISRGEFKGAHILITLGWLPFETAKNWQPPETFSKTMEIMAVTRPALVPTWLTPANKPDKGEWYSLYIPEIASFYGLKPFLPFSAQLTQPLEDINQQMPLLLPQQLELTNNHLQYAITWYVLAGVLVVMGIVGVREVLGCRV